MHPAPISRHPAPISRRFALAAAGSALALAAARPAFAAGKNDFVIVPGKSFGAIRKGATLASIEKAYGKANVRVRAVQPPHADLPKQRAAVIFPGTPDEAVALLTRAGRAEGVYVEKAGGKWATREGLRVGLPVEEMERRFGGPFAITGFGQDGGGAVNREPAKAPARALYIRFRATRTEKAPDDDEAALNAEKGFRSDHPAARRAKLVVSVIWWEIR